MTTLMNFLVEAACVVLVLSTVTGISSTCSVISEWQINNLSRFKELAEQELQDKYVNEGGSVIQLLLMEAYFCFNR